MAEKEIKGRTSGSTTKTKQNIVFKTYKEYIHSERKGELSAYEEEKLDEEWADERIVAREERNLEEMLRGEDEDGS